MLVFYKQATVRALKGRTQHRTNQTNLGSKSQGSHPRGSEPQLGDQIETILLRCHFISAALQTPPKAVKILVDSSTSVNKLISKFNLVWCLYSYMYSSWLMSISPELQRPRREGSGIQESFGLCSEYQPVLGVGRSQTLYRKIEVIDQTQKQSCRAFHLRQKEKEKRKKTL